MTSTVFASPLLAPEPVARSTAWPGMTFLWTGWDESVWNIGTRRFGTYLKAARGLHMPPFRRFTSQSAGVAGTRHRGSQADEREVFWRLRTYSGEGSQAWIDRDAAFWHTLHPERPGVWSVQQPSGETRYLTCRFVQSETTIETDPSRVGWGRYEVYLVAEDPFWRGVPIVRTWGADDAQDFIPAEGAPPFYISQPSTFGTAKVTNPGDENAHPIWLLTDYATATVGVGAAGVTVPFDVDPGKALVVDTRPTALTAKEIPAPPGELTAQQVLDWISDHAAVAINRTKELGDAAFAPVPPGQSVDLNISMTGDGNVQMILVPLHHRAW